ncbi:hypothetical protein JVX91_04585 [Pseudomonas sp. PDNC002]|uniref:hypothetical protein n=1 Tax=Pseudomonas sp. PDNC002 TaxID=2811422 RepID=UPI001964E61D|nr:hypothetical protein [Pseudomonas sp. PDNC002]QRY80402.1 hypothetical protein JVX91_04585 [Pseudomonas sp. PDNC002]
MKLGNALFPLLIAAFCSACMKDHHQPTANLTYLRSEPVTGRISFNLYFASDLDLDDVYSHLEGSGKIGQRLVCSLEREPIFAMDHVIPVFGYGTVDRIGQDSGQYLYSSSLHFSETEDEGRSDRFINQQRFKEVLAGRTSIPCKVVMNAYGYKAYFSHTLTLPAGELLPLLLEQ